MNPPASRTSRAAAAAAAERRVVEVVVVDERAQHGLGPIGHANFITDDSCQDSIEISARLQMIEIETRVFTWFYRMIAEFKYRR